MQVELSSTHVTVKSKNKVFSGCLVFSKINSKIEKQRLFLFADEDIEEVTITAMHPFGRELIADGPVTMYCVSGKNDLELSHKSYLGRCTVFKTYEPLTCHVEKFMNYFVSLDGKIVKLQFQFF